MLPRRRLLACLALLVFPVAPRAEAPFLDPAQERRARALMSEIRCVVCQSQSIAESDAEIAADMRNLIRERLAAGDDDREILDYLVSRYGDFVLLKPPFKRATWVLWLGPFAIFALALGAGILFLRRRGLSGQPGELSTAERARVAALLQDGIGERDGGPT